MNCRAALIALGFVMPALVGAQSSVDLAGNRPATPGITRTTLKDDEKVSVTRVHFAPGASEVPHTHPYDIMIIPVRSGPVVMQIGEKKITEIRSGDVQFVPREVSHFVGSANNTEFELIAVAVKSP